MALAGLHLADGIDHRPKVHLIGCIGVCRRSKVNQPVRGGEGSFDFRGSVAECRKVGDDVGVFNTVDAVAVRKCPGGAAARYRVENR
jgi:hypothetical protein